MPLLHSRFSKAGATAVQIPEVLGGLTQGKLAAAAGTKGRLQQVQLHYLLEDGDRRGWVEKSGRSLTLKELDWHRV